MDFGAVAGLLFMNVYKPMMGSYMIYMMDDKSWCMGLLQLCTSGERINQAPACIADGLYNPFLIELG